MKLTDIIDYALGCCLEVLGKVLDTESRAEGLPVASRLCLGWVNAASPYRATLIDKADSVMADPRFDGLTFYRGIEEALAECYSLEFVGLYVKARDAFAALDHEELIGDAAIKIRNGGMALIEFKKQGDYWTAGMIAEKLAGDDPFRRGETMDFYERHGRMKCAGSIAERIASLPSDLGIFNAQRMIWHGEALRLYEQCKDWESAARVAYRMGRHGYALKLYRRAGCRAEAANIAEEMQRDASEFEGL